MNFFAAAIVQLRAESFIPGPFTPMNKLNKVTLTIIASSLVGVMPMMAQQQKRLSPHETISKEIDKSRVIVIYGRPNEKDPKTGEERKIWGGLVPFGKVWRTGADEATLLVTQKPLVFGDSVVPAGAYSLFTLPMEDGNAKLIISKQLGEWGAYTYDEKQDLARVDLKKEDLSTPVTEFTMALDKEGDAGGVLKMMWASTGYSVQFTVKK